MFFITRSWLPTYSLLQLPRHSLFVPSSLLFNFGRGGARQQRPCWSRCPFAALQIFCFLLLSLWLLLLPLALILFQCQSVYISNEGEGSVPLSHGHSFSSYLSGKVHLFTAFLSDYPLRKHLLLFFLFPNRMVVGMRIIGGLRLGVNLSRDLSADLACPINHSSGLLK